MYLFAQTQKKKMISEKCGANVLGLRAKYLSDDNTNVKDVLKNF